MPTKTKKQYDKKRNRFMSLRYKSEAEIYADHTIEELSKKFDCSKSTISGLEREKATEEELLSTSARLFKAYHDYFGCSYEYLFGETKATDSKLLTLDSKSPLLHIGSSSLDKLNQMLTDSEFADFNKYMLTAILSDPKALQSIMAIVFEELYIINQIYSNTKLHKAEKEINSSKYWAKINENVENYLTCHLLPHLQRGFRLYEEKEIQRGKDIVNLADETEEKSHATLTGTLIENNNIE